MLKRFFGLGEGSTGGPQATVVHQTIVLDAKLERALGFYKTTAFNLDLDLTLRGSDLQNVNLQAQLGDGRQRLGTTNPGPQGKVMSVAFNDLGTMLRLLNVYPNLEGGAGHLVLQTNDDGRLRRRPVHSSRNFAIVNEANVDADHRATSRAVRAAVASRQQARVRQRPGRVHPPQGSRRDQRSAAEPATPSAARRAASSTPTAPVRPDRHLCAAVRAQQRVPADAAFGPLLGGREGEGLFGVTFAVRGAARQAAVPDQPAVGAGARARSADCSSSRSRTSACGGVRLRPVAAARAASCRPRA